MLTALRQLWHLPAPAGTRPGPDVRAGTRRDAAGRIELGLVTYFGVFAVLEAVGSDSPPAWRWWALAALLAWLPTLLVRRTRPLLPVLAFAASSAVLAGVAVVSGTPPGDLTAGIAALVIPYSLARWASGRDAVLGIALFAFVAGIALTAQDLALGDRVGGTAVVLASVAIGAAVRSRAMLHGRQLDDVRRDERERLARDLHDTVAHHLTAIAISAQAGLAVADDEPEAARRALRRIDEEATRTLAETRTVVQVLRTAHDAEVAPDRPLDDLSGLVALATAGGPGPRVEVDLEPDLDVSPTVAAALQRIAREAVVNAHRHATDATYVRVRVARTGEDRVELGVVDDGRGTPRAGDGYGIVGMAERATLLGGTLDAGPLPGGGWQVRAELPDATR